MFSRRLISPAVLAVTVASLVLPLVVGPGCPGPQEVSPLIVSAGEDRTIDVGETAQLQGSATGGIQPYTYAWSSSPAAPGLTGADSAAASFVSQATGSFLLTLTVTDGSGQVSSDAATISVGQATAASAALAVDAGPNRMATVGAPITLVGSVSGGQEPYVVSWSPAADLADASSLSPTFVPSAEGEYEFTLSVADHKGASASRAVKVNAFEHAALGSLKWGANFAGGGYQLIAQFTKPVDEATAENVVNYSVSGTEVNPASATLGADNVTVTLLFNGDPLVRETRFDVGIDDGILGSDGVAVPEVAGLPAAANGADTQVPTVSARRWVTGADVAEAEEAEELRIWNEMGVEADIRYSYLLQVVFSEAVDRASVETAAAYRIQDGSNRYVPSIASLAEDGKTVTLFFENAALARDAKLDTGLLPIRDINGLMLVLETGKSVSNNSEDKTAPTIVEDSVRFVAGVEDGGYQVELEFSEPMDRASVENAASYSLDGHAASEAELADDGRRVTLSFENLTASTSSKLSIPANHLKDINAVALAAQNNLSILPAETEMASPGVPTLTWLPGDKSTGYQIWAEFAVAMDKTSVEKVSNWRITGTSIHPTSVVLHSTTDAAAGTIAGRTALITFANTTMSRLNKLDVSVGGSILDINTIPVEQVSIAIAASPDDATPPIIVPLPGGTEAKPVWGDAIAGSYGNTQYVVSLAFSETLDARTAINTENYLLGGVHPTSTELDVAGRIVVLTFGDLETGLGSADRLQLFSTIRDINGLANPAVTPLTILPGNDTTAPQITSVVWLENALPYQVVVEFNEVMDRDSVEVVDKWDLDVSGSAEKPTAVLLDPSDPARAVLTFELGAFAATAELGLTGEIRDLSGNAYSGGLALPRAPSPDPGDHASPRILSVMWAADSSTGYQVIVGFSESIDEDNAGTFTLEGIPPADTQVADGGGSVIVTFPDPAVPTVFSRGVRIAASGSKDMAGNTLSAVSKNVVSNPADLAGPSPAKVIWAADYAGVPDEYGYQVIVEFSEVLDALTAQLAANYQITGTFSKPATAVLDPVDGLTVTLTFPSMVLNGGLSADDTLDVSVGNSILDVNGLFGLQASVDIEANEDDTTPPTIVETAVMDPEVMVVFSEAMDRTSAGDVNNYVLDPGTTDLLPTAATLLADGQTVILTFDGSVTGLMLRISNGDSIEDVNTNAVPEEDVGPL